jgi:hypothetical protein
MPEGWSPLADRSTRAIGRARRVRPHDKNWVAKSCGEHSIARNPAIGNSGAPTPTPLTRQSMARGLDLELAPSVRTERPSREPGLRTGLSFSLRRLTINPPVCTMKGFIVPTVNPLSWRFAAGPRSESRNRS